MWIHVHHVYHVYHVFLATLATAQLGCAELVQKTLCDTPIPIV